MATAVDTDRSTCIAMLDQFVSDYPADTVQGRQIAAAALQNEHDQSAYAIQTYVGLQMTLGHALRDQEPLQDPDVTGFERMSEIVECLFATRDSFSAAEADYWAGFLKLYPEPRRVEFLRAAKAQDADSWAIMGIDEECGLAIRQAKHSKDVPDRCFGK